MKNKISNIIISFLVGASIGFLCGFWIGPISLFTTYFLKTGYFLSPVEPGYTLVFGGFLGLVGGVVSGFLLGGLAGTLYGIFSQKIEPKRLIILTIFAGVIDALIGGAVIGHLTSSHPLY